MALHTNYIDWEEKANWKLEKEEKDSFNQRRIGLDFFFFFSLLLFQFFILLILFLLIVQYIQYHMGGCVV